MVDEEERSLLVLEIQGEWGFHRHRQKLVIVFSSDVVRRHSIRSSDEEREKSDEGTDKANVARGNRRREREGTRPNQATNWRDRH